MSPLDTVIEEPYLIASIPKDWPFDTDPTTLAKTPKYCLAVVGDPLCVEEAKEGSTGIHCHPP